MRLLAVHMMFRDLPFYNETLCFPTKSKISMKYISVAKSPHGILMEELAGSLHAVSIA